MGSNSFRTRPWLENVTVDEASAMKDDDGSEVGDEDVRWQLR